MCGATAPINRPIDAMNIAPPTMPPASIGCSHFDGRSHVISVEEATVPSFLSRPCAAPRAAVIRLAGHVWRSSRHVTKRYPGGIPGRKGQRFPKSGNIRMPCLCKPALALPVPRQEHRRAAQADELVTKRRRAAFSKPSAQRGLMGWLPRPHKIVRARPGNGQRGGSWPTRPSIDSRMRSAWPL